MGGLWGRGIYGVMFVPSLAASLLGEPGMGACFAPLGHGIL